MITRRFVAMVLVASCAAALAGRAAPVPMSWKQHQTLWTEAKRDPGRRQAILDELLGVFDGTRILQPAERPEGYASTESLLLHVLGALNDAAAARRALDGLMDADAVLTLTGADAVRTWRIAAEVAWQFHCLDEYIALMRLGKARGYPIGRLQQWSEATGEVSATFVERGSTMHIRMSTLRASMKERQDREPDSALWDEWLACLLEAKRIRDNRRK